MKKRFLTNLALLVLLNLLIKPFWFFGIEVGVQNRVGEEMYGFYFSLFNFSFILNILLDVGINNFNNRAISREHTLVRDYLTAIIPVKLLLFIVYAGLVAISGKLIGYSPEQFKLLAVLVVNQFMASFILYMRTNISGLQFYRTDSLLSVLDRALMIVFTGILLWGNVTEQEFRIQWFVYAQTLSYFITLLTVSSIVRYRAGPLVSIGRLNLRKSLGILRLSYPFALLILLMALFNRVDSVMLERLLENGKTEAGIYAQSFRVFDAASQFSLLFAMLLLPMFARMIKTGENLNDLIRTALSILLTAGITVAVTGNFYKSEIIDLLYVSTSDHSPVIFGLLMVGFLFVSTSYIFGTLLTANNNLKELNILAGITVVINISLNLLLIPRLQSTGAAIASVTSQGFYALSQWIMATRILSLPSNGDILLRLSAFLALILVAGYLSLKMQEWIPGFLLLSATCLLAAILLGLLKPGELISSIRSSN